MCFLFISVSGFISASSPLPISNLMPLFCFGYRVHWDLAQVTSLGNCSHYSRIAKGLVRLLSLCTRAKSLQNSHIQLPISNKCPLYLIFCSHWECHAVSTFLQFQACLWKKEIKKYLRLSWVSMSPDSSNQKKSLLDFFITRDILNAPFFKPIFTPLWDSRN